MSIEISSYDPKYKEAFKELNLAWIRRFFAVEDKDVEQLENPERILEQGGEIVFALFGGDAVGTCAVINEGNGVFELAKMAVDPDFQGQGIAHGLMKAAEKFVRERGGKKIYLVSNQSLAPAITLYKKHGYIVTSLTQNPEYSRGNIEMEKLF
ncbi:MAG TPA: GNAT family N-acetyltransferase [Bdellovibrionales bacterium]|nr:GNAT family N-acetyltransferase [Bdellovibrionales bacterium]